MAVKETNEAKHFVCLANETKPATAPDGSTCIVVDTPAKYMCLANTWHDITALNQAVEDET
jgi:hypothetical protein